MQQVLRYATPDPFRKDSDKTCQYSQPEPSDLPVTSVTLDTMEPCARTGRRHAGIRFRPAGIRGYGTRLRGWRAVLTALAAVTALTVAGCGSSTGQAARPGTTATPRLAAPAVRPGASGTYSRSGVDGGALFGGNTKLVPEEARLGRSLAIVRVYYRLGESFPRPADRRLMAEGTTLLVSLDTVPGDPGYASIAASHQDAAIAAFLKAVNQAAVQYRLLRSISASSTRRTRRDITEGSAPPLSSSRPGITSTNSPSRRAWTGPKAAESTGSGS